MREISLIATPLPHLFCNPVLKDPNTLNLEKKCENKIRGFSFHVIDQQEENSRLES